MPVRIALVDDHQILREGLKLRLQTEADFLVIAEMSSAEELYRTIVDSKPDLVLMDFELPGDDGVKAAKKVRTLSPETYVLLLSGSKRPVPAQEVILAGAGGFIRKEDAGTELVRAIRQVLDGKTYLSVDAATSLAASIREREANPEPSITEREQDVLKLVADGLGYKEIATEMGVSIKSVETYRARLGKKLGLHTRAELVRYAIRKGLVNP